MTVEICGIDFISLPIDLKVFKRTLPITITTSSQVINEAREFGDDLAPER